MINVQRVLKIIATALNCPESTLSFESGLGKHYLWDSLGQIAIVSSLEGEFMINVDEDNIEKLLTVKDILQYLNDQEV